MTRNRGRRPARPASPIAPPASFSRSCGADAWTRAHACRHHRDAPQRPDIGRELLQYRDTDEAAHEDDIDECAEQPGEHTTDDAPLTCLPAMCASIALATSLSRMQIEHNALMSTFRWLPPPWTTAHPAPPAPRHYDGESAPHCLGELPNAGDDWRRAIVAAIAAGFAPSSSGAPKQSQNLRPFSARAPGSSLKRLVHDDLACGDFNTVTPGIDASDGGRRPRLLWRREARGPVSRS